MVRPRPLFRECRMDLVRLRARLNQEGLKQAVHSRESSEMPTMGATFTKLPMQGRRQPDKAIRTSANE